MLCTKAPRNGFARKHFGLPSYMIVGISIIWTLKLAISVHREDLFKRYKSQRSAQNITELENLTPAMMGARADPDLKTKAMECRWLVPFCVHILEKYSGVIDNHNLVFAGQCLMQLIHNLETAPAIVPRDVAHSIFNLYRSHFEFARLGGVRIVPKHHYLLHCFSRIVYTGNPKYFAFFFDESFNKNLAATRRGAFSVHFERRVLEFFKSGNASLWQKRAKGLEDKAARVKSG